MSRLAYYDACKAEEPLPNPNLGIITEKCDCVCHDSAAGVYACEDGCKPADSDEPYEWTWKCIGGTRYKIVDWRE